MKLQYTDRGFVYASWRNVHTRVPDNLSELIRDAYVLPRNVFNLIYGPSVYSFKSSDNSVRVASYYRALEYKPITISRAVSRKTDPRKKDLVAVIEGDEKYYGVITWISKSNDEVGVWVFKDKKMETYGLDVLETARDMGRNVKWRINLC